MSIYITPWFRRFRGAWLPVWLAVTRDRREPVGLTHPPSISKIYFRITFVVYTRCMKALIYMHTYRCNVLPARPFKTLVCPVTAEQLDHPGLNYTNLNWLSCEQLELHYKNGRQKMS